MAPVDYAVIAVYAACVLALGVRAGRGHGSAADLMLARRSLPAWAALCSMVATELSAATFIGVPNAAYVGDWSYLQLAFGALLGKLVLAATAIPLYHRLRVVTVYGALEHRFGPRSRRAAALCFVAGRVLASGVRLYIAALAFAVASGLDVSTAIVVSGGVASAYTLAAGLRGVVFTDVLQGAVFLAAALACAVVLVTRADGGVSGLLAWAEAHERTRILHLAPALALADARPFLVGVIGGFALTLATHGTDHDMVQRLLAVRDGRAGARALLGSALLNFPLTALFLFIGTGLAFVYATPPAYEIGDSARILPIFALHELPAGARGLLFAGLFAAAMSSFDSAVCAIATTFAVDVRHPAADDAALARRVRRATLGAGALLVAAALAAAAYQRALPPDPALPLSLVDFALSAMTVLYGGLLGVFAFGIATRGRGSDASAVAGLATGAAVGLALFLHPIWLGYTAIAWPWWIPLGGGVAAAVTASRRPASPARPKPAPNRRAQRAEGERSQKLPRGKKTGGAPAPSAPPPATTAPPRPARSRCR